MEDKILNACGSRIHPTLLTQAIGMSGVKSGKIVMRKEQVRAYQLECMNLFQPNTSEPLPEPIFVVHESLDIPMDEVHIETPKCRVKIINITIPKESIFLLEERKEV